MPQFDLTRAELEQYSPDIAEPADFDEFWSASIAEARAAQRPTTVTSVESALRTVEVFDVTFSGFAGDPVSAWLVLPSDAEGPLPTVVEYIGYGGGRGLPHERLSWASAGYAHFVMDTRGQGAVWSGGGSTPDPHGSGPSFPGFMTRGITDPQSYYYRRVYVDAVRAVDAARSLPQVDASRVSVVGTSQGGGISLAAAALSDGLIAVLPEVPFLCHFGWSVAMAPEGPYTEIANYLRVHRGQEEDVLQTLSYFDGATMASRATAPAQFSVGLMDTVTPPTSVYAAHNRYAGQKELVVYPFNGHEGGGQHHWLAQTEFLARQLRDTTAQPAAEGS